MALSSLTELDKYKAAPFPPGYPDTTRTFYSPVDQVHLALKDELGKLAYWARTDFDRTGQCGNGCTALSRPECPAVGEPVQELGQAFDVVGKCPGRVELGDPLHQCIATDLDSPGGADGFAAVIQDARVIDVVRPGTDRAEVREDIPDLLWAHRDGAAAGNVGHRPTVRDEKCGGSAFAGGPASGCRPRQVQHSGPNLRF